MTKKKSADLENLRESLVARRKELMEWNTAHSDARKPVQVDQTSMGRLSRMDALQNQAMELELERRRKVELARLEAALQRIEEGEYGYCVACGEKIAKKRLENDPTTPVCINCARDSGQGE